MLPHAGARPGSLDKRSALLQSPRLDACRTRIRSQHLLSTEPPSLAARLEQTGPLHWREAARLAARVARALDRLHAQLPAHGGIEPLTILFVGGTVRLADPLPLENRDPAFVAPPVAAGEPADRQSDFFALGRLMAVMVAPEKAVSPEGSAEDSVTGSARLLPAPLAAVARRLVADDPSRAYASGNDIAAALELAIAASEGFAAAPPEPLESPEAPAPPSLQPEACRALPKQATAPASKADTPPPSPAPRSAISPTPAPNPAPTRPSTAPPADSATSAVASLPRRRRPRTVLALVALLILGGLAVLWLRPADEALIERRADTTEPPPVATVPLPTDRQLDAVKPSRRPEAVEDLPLEQVLALLPDSPSPPTPAEPATRGALEALLKRQHERPCTRLEVEPTAIGLRLVGSTASADDRTELLAAVRMLDDLDRVSLALDEAGSFCRLYDMLAAHTEPAIPRLGDLFPARPDYRLAGGEPLVLRVLTPAFPSHLLVDYFTADGMVVHLAERRPEAPPLPPVETVWIGDPTDGEWLTIAEPYGDELIAVIASREPLFAQPRSRIEPAEAYLEALEAALAERARKPIASTIAIRTSPPGN